MKNGLTNFFKFSILLAALLLHSINSRADTVYVWSYDGTIQKFATNGIVSLVTNNVSGWNGPVGLVCDNVGNLYDGVPSISRIWRFSPDGTQMLIGFIDSASALAFDWSGNLSVTIPNYSEIDQLDPGGFGYYLNGHSTNHVGARYPISLAFDAAGNFYAVNNTNASPSPFNSPSADDNTVQKFSSNFSSLGTFASGLNQPWGLVFDTNGNLFVSNSGNSGLLNNSIVKFTTNGIRSTFANVNSGLSSPRGLAFDSAGNLYVANSGSGNILKFSPAGVSSVFASGLGSPSSIAIFPGRNVWSATPIKLNNAKVQSDGAFQFDFIDNLGLSLNALSSTNLSSWASLGSVMEISPGHYQFTDSQATNILRRFYRISSP